MKYSIIDIQPYQILSKLFFGQNNVGKMGQPGRSNYSMGYSAGKYWWHEKNFFQALESPTAF